jgi:integrase
MRYFGLRASEAGLLKVQELESLLEGTENLTVYQPKVNAYRLVLVTEDMRRDLRTHHREDLLRLKAVHGGNSEVCLSASCQGKTKGSPLCARDWVSGLNKILQGFAKKEGLKGITTHCFRVNFITCMLTKLPIQQVQKIVGHRDIKTTAVYDRFDLQKDSLLLTMSEALNTRNVPVGKRKVRL